jgi:hypothetical protein
MKTVNIDGLELDEKKIAELKEWYQEGSGKNPEDIVAHIQNIRELLTRVWVEGVGVSESKIKECVEEILFLEDIFKNLI